MIINFKIKTCHRQKKKKKKKKLQIRRKYPRLLSSNSPFQTGARNSLSYFRRQKEAGGRNKVEADFCRPCQIGARTIVLSTSLISVYMSFTFLYARLRKLHPFLVRVTDLCTMLFPIFLRLPP